VPVFEFPESATVSRLSSISLESGRVLVAVNEALDGGESGTRVIAIDPAAYVADATLLEAASRGRLGLSDGDPYLIADGGEGRCLYVPLGEDGRTTGAPVVLGGVDFRCRDAASRLRGSEMVLVAGWTFGGRSIRGMAGSLPVATGTGFELSGTQFGGLSAVSDGALVAVFDARTAHLYEVGWTGEATLEVAMELEATEVVAAVPLGADRLVLGERERFGAPTKLEIGAAGGAYPAVSLSGELRGLDALSVGSGQTLILASWIHSDGGGRLSLVAEDGTGRWTTATLFEAPAALEAALSTDESRDINVVWMAEHRLWITVVRCS